MAYIQKSEDLKNTMKGMADNSNYGSKEISEEDKKEKLKAKAIEKGWSERKQVRKGIVEDPTENIPKNYKAVWKKGEFIGAREKLSIGGIFGGGGKIPNTPGSSDNDESQDINNSTKKTKGRIEQSPYRSKYLKRGKHLRQGSMFHRHKKKHISGYNR